MKEPSETDMAQLRHEMRQLYYHVGYVGCLQVFYEMLLGIQTLGAIMAEEREKERRSN